MKTRIMSWFDGHDCARLSNEEIANLLPRELGGLSPLEREALCRIFTAVMHLAEKTKGNANRKRRTTRG